MNLDFLWSQKTKDFSEQKQKCRTGLEQSHAETPDCTLTNQPHTFEPFERSVGGVTFVRILHGFPHFIFWKMETKVGTALFIVSVGIRTLNLQQYVHHGHITLMTMLFYYCSYNYVNPLSLHPPDNIRPKPELHPDHMLD